MNLPAWIGNAFHRVAGQPGDAASPFPDLDEAWAAVMAALDKANIGIGDTPVFIVLGQPQAGEAGLFTGLPRGPLIDGAPSAASPIRVYAHREAIYLCCPGASLLGIQGGEGGPSILDNVHELQRMTARMHHFGALIARSRWPLCPISGAMIVVSAAAADKDETAQQTGLVAQKDLANLVDALQLRFPVYALVADLDALPGADEFLKRFAKDRRQQRLGKSFPLNPDLKPGSVPEAIETGVNWIFQSLLPYWVYKLFRLEAPDVETPNQAAEANGKLFRFLVAVKERAEKLGRLVSRAVVPHADETPSYGGCYLTATDSVGSTEPLFIEEFFKKVESTQGFVEWTPDAFAQDASYRAKTKMGYLVLAAIAGAVAALAVYVLGIHSS